MENKKSKPGFLLLIQVDSISGELLGAAIDSFYDAGAKNVQIVSSITKKNRPGYLVLIDSPAERIEEIEHVIVTELSVTGWHLIPTEHKYVSVEVKRKVFQIKTKNETFSFIAEAKWSDSDPELYRPEMDSCLQLKNTLLEKGVKVSTPAIYKKLQHSFQTDEKSPILYF